MSNSAMRWARRQTVGNPTAKYVLLLLADAADADGYCHPSLTTLEKDSELGRSSVVRSINHLLNIGLIGRERRRRENGSNAASSYKLAVGDSATVALPVSLNGILEPPSEPASPSATARDPPLRSGSRCRGT